MARLQQLMVLVSLSLAGLCLAGSFQSPHPAGWWALALGCLLPHAPILAMECLWAAQVNRRAASRKALGGWDEPVAAASAFEWCRAWWREVGHGWRVFGWQQPFFERSEADGQSRSSARGVLLVHGYVCNRGFWNPWLRRLRQRGIACSAVTLEPVFADIDTLVPQLASAYEALLAHTGRAPVIVAHSMGGLVVRALLRRGRLSRPPHAVVTIGTPHYGTVLASLAQSDAGRQMQVLNDWLKRLAAEEWSGHEGAPATSPAPAPAESPYARYTCFWSTTDCIVFPANTATLPGARNRCVPGLPHVGLAQSPVVWQEVMALLEDGAGEP